MTEYSDRSRWWFFAVAALIAVAAGFFAYNLGVSHGAAVAMAQPPAGTAPSPYPYPYGWHRHWGFGFGPFFFILLLFLLFRGWCWGGPWGRRWYYEDRPRVKEGASADNPGRG